MKIREQIVNFIRGGRKVYRGSFAGIFGGWYNPSTGEWKCLSSLQYADTIYYSLVKLLSDLNHDVTWQFNGSNPQLESAFVRFFNTYSSLVMHRLYGAEGVVVIKHTQVGTGVAAAHEFGIAVENTDYIKSEKDGWTEYGSIKEGVEVYAMSSPARMATGKGDKALAAPILELLNNTLNASNTISSRLGAVVVASPKTPNNAPISVVLDDEEKKAIEKEWREQYGIQSEQSQVMVLPREMSFQVISLATLDLKTPDKVKMAVCALADQIGIPANQSALIDANSSKALSNGSELLAGDFAKYQSFERVFDCTWVQFARDCGLQPGMEEEVQGEPVKSYYTIYNKPQVKTEQSNG